MERGQEYLLENGKAGRKRGVGMEKLTERTADGILVKENYEKESLKTLYSCYGENRDCERRWSEWQRAELVK